jgi:hypothetical protein
MPACTSDKPGGATYKINTSQTSFLGIVSSSLTEGRSVYNPLEI